MNRNRPPAPESSPSEKSSTAHGSPSAKKFIRFSRGRATRLMSPAVEGLEDRTLQTALPPEGSLPWHYVTQTTIPFTTPNAQAVDPSHPHKFIDQYDTTVVGQLSAGVSKHTASVLSKPNDAGALDPLLSIVKKGKDTLDDTVRHINAAHLLLDDAEIFLAGWQAKGAPAFDGEPNHQPFSPADFAAVRISLDASKAKLDGLTQVADELKRALDKAETALQEAIKKEVEKQKNLDAATIELADATSTLDGAKKLLDQKNALVDSTQKALDTDTSALNVLQAKVAAAHAIFWKAAEDYIPVARESEAHPEDLVLKARAQALLDICLPLYQNYLTIRNASISPLYVLRSRISDNTVILEVAKAEQTSAKSAFDSAHATYINALATVASLQSLLDAATTERIAAQTDRDAKLKAYTDALASETATLKEGIAVSTILFQRLTATDKTFHNTFDAALDTLVADERGLTDILHDKQHEGIASLMGQASTVTGLPMDRVASAAEITNAVKELNDIYTLLITHLSHGQHLLATVTTALQQVEFTDDQTPVAILKSNLSAYTTALSDAIAALIAANTHSRVETYTETISMNFSTFGDGIHPNGTTATVPDIGAVTLYGDDYFGVQVLSNALTFSNGRSPSFGFGFKNGEKFVESVDISDRGRFAYDAFVVAYSSTGEKSYHIEKNGTVKIGQMASSIAINPGSNGAFTMNNIQIPVQKERTVIDPINPIDIGDIPGALTFIDQKLQDYTAFIASPGMQPAPGETDIHGTAAMDRQAARLEKFSGISADTEAVIRFLESALTDSTMVGTPELKAYLAQAQTLSDRIAQINDQWQHDNRALVFRQTKGVITEAGAMLDMRSTVVPAMVGPASQGDNPSLSTGVPELGGTIVVTAVRGGTSTIPVFNSVGQSIGTGGKLTTIDLSSIKSVVTEISFVVDADLPTTVHFLRGETIISSQIVDPGDRVSYADDVGMTGVIVEHALTPLSQLAQDALHDIDFGEVRVERLWDLRNYGGRYTDTLDKLLSSYLGRHRIQLSTTDFWALMEELKQGGPKAAIVTVSDIMLTGAQDYTHIDAPNPLTVSGNGVLASKTGRLDSAHPVQLGEFAGDVYIPQGAQTVRNPVNWYKVNPNPNGYTRFNILGDATIGSMGYIGSNGLTELPSEWYEIINGKTVIIKPNAPLNLAVCVSSCSGTYEVVNGKNGSLDKESVTPPENMTLMTDFDGPYVQMATEGFIDGKFDNANKRRQHVLFGASQSAYTISNIGTTGGTVIVNVYSGYASSKVRGETIGTYSTTIGALSQKTLVVNVRPASGVPAKKEEAVMITFVTALPDGTEKVDTIALNTRADTTMSSSISADGTVVTKPIPITPEEKLRLDRIVSRIEVAANGGKPIVRTTHDALTILALQYKALYPVISYATTDIAVMKDAAQEEDPKLLKAGAAVVTTALKVVGADAASKIQSLNVLARNLTNLVQRGMQVDWGGADQDLLPPSSLFNGPGVPANYAARSGFTPEMITKIEALVAFFKTDAVQNYVKGTDAKNIVNAYNDKHIPVDVTYNTSLAWYDSKNPVPGLGSTDVRNDTAIGKMLLGILQQFEQKKNDKVALIELSRMVQDLTNIPWQRVIGTTIGTDASKRAEYLESLFAYAGYNHIFAKNQPTASPGIANAVTDNSEYTKGNIRVRYDLQNVSTPLRFVRVFMDTGSGNMEQVGGTRHSQFFLDIPVSSIRYTGLVKLTLVAELANGTTSTVSIGTINIIPQNLRDLSTTENNDAKHKQENAILNVLAQPGYFPVTNASNWSWNIASSFHDGKAVNAVDLNLPGFSDRGAEIVSPDSGVVTNIKVASGTMDIAHTARGKTWTSQILHMPIQAYKDESGTVVEEKFFIQKITEQWIDSNDTKKGSQLFFQGTRIVYERNTETGTYRSWKEVQATDKTWKMEGEKRENISAQDLLGFVGNQDGSGKIDVSANSLFSPHLHYEVLDEVLSSIDLRKLMIDGLKITNIHAEDAGADGKQYLTDDNVSLAVHWDDTIGGFVSSADANNITANNPWLVLDRTDQKSDANVPDADSNQFWLAWEADDKGNLIMDVTQLKRVVLKNLQYMNDEGVMDTKAIWVNLNDDKRRWNPVKRKFVDRLTNV